MDPIRLLSRGNIEDGSAGEEDSPKTGRNEGERVSVIDESHREPPAGRESISGHRHAGATQRFAATLGEIWMG
jgi:hypothetical protein